MIDIKNLTVQYAQYYQSKELLKNLLSNTTWINAHYQLKHNSSCGGDKDWFIVSCIDKLLNATFVCSGSGKPIFEAAVYYLSLTLTMKTH